MHRASSQRATLLASSCQALVSVWFVCPLLLLFACMQNRLAWYRLTRADSRRPRCIPAEATWAEERGEPSNSDRL